MLCYRNVFVSNPINMAAPSAPTLLGPSEVEASLGVQVTITLIVDDVSGLPVVVEMLGNISRQATLQLVGDQYVFDWVPSAVEPVALR